MKKTASKGLHRFKKGVWEWCKKNRHKSLKVQYETLCSKLRGYYQYFGVICNFKAIANAQYSTLRAWRYWLYKRSHKGKIKYEDLSAQYHYLKAADFAKAMPGFDPESVECYLSKTKKMREEKK